MRRCCRRRRRRRRAAFAAAAGEREGLAAAAAAAAAWSSSGRGTNLVLVGGRGCGKSSVSRRIAAAEKRFEKLSTDYLLRYEAEGNDVATVVAERGWGGFRDLEYEVTRKCCNFTEWALLDTGGGIVVDLDDSDAEVFSQRKVDVLRQSGFVVYVSRPVEYLEGRVAKKAAKEAKAKGKGGGDVNRPTLSAKLRYVH